MAQRLSRSKLAAICRAYDGGELGARLTSATIAPTIILIKNGGSGSINAGAPVAVSSYASAPVAYADAVRRMNNSTLVLTAQAGGAHAIALERIAPGKIGRAASLGLCFHAVTINDAAHDYVDANFQTVATIDYYALIAKSATSNGVAICALFHEPQGGGSAGTLTASVSNNVLTLEIV